MHEWALAETVVATVLKVADEQDLRAVTTIVVALGKLQQIEKEIFRFAIREMIRPHGRRFKKTRIRIRDESAMFKCRVCGHTWKYSGAVKKLNTETTEAIHFVPEVVHAYLGCPECRSPDFDIVQGRGMSIDSITGERNE